MERGIVDNIGPGVISVGGLVGYKSYSWKSGTYKASWKNFIVAARGAYHYNILNNGFMVGESLGLTACDRMVIPVPLYHCFGMVMANLGCITHGSTMIYPNDAFDAARQCAAALRLRRK